MAKITKRMKKDGTCSYCIRVSNGYDRRGRQVMVNRTFTPPPGMTGKKLEKELQRQADAFEQEVHAGVLLDASMKVDDLIERWFTEYAEKKLKPKTVYNYRRLVPRISAGLGQLKVCQVKPAHLMAFYSNLEEQGVREDSTYTATPALLERLPHGKRGQIAKAAGIGDDTMRNVYRGANVSQSTAEKVAGVVGLPLSKAFTEHAKDGGRLNGNTVQHYHRMLSSVFTKAVQWGLVPENPCKRAEAPKAEEIDVQALEEKDVARLLEALQDAPAQFSVITQLALFTGARRSEICGLRWCDVHQLQYKDIDFSSNRLTILQQKVQSHSKNAILHLNLNHTAIKLLQRHKGINEDLVFGLPSYSYTLRILNKWVKRANIHKHITFHCARHSFITNIMANGANIKTAASLAGHSTTRHTEKYVHIIDELKQKAVDSLPDIIVNYK